jgi:hypothetical protein
MPLEVGDAPSVSDTRCKDCGIDSTSYGDEEMQDVEHFVGEVGGGCRRNLVHPQLICRRLRRFHFDQGFAAGIHVPVFEFHGIASVQDRPSAAIYCRSIDLSHRCKKVEQG